MIKKNVLFIIVCFFVFDIYAQKLLDNEKPDIIPTTSTDSNYESDATITDEAIPTEETDQSVLETNHKHLSFTFSFGLLSGTVPTGLFMQINEKNFRLFEENTTTDMFLIRLNIPITLLTIKDISLFNRLTLIELNLDNEITSEYPKSNNIEDYNLISYFSYKIYLKYTHLFDFNTANVNFFMSTVPKYEKYFYINNFFSTTSINGQIGLKLNIPSINLFNFYPVLSMDYFSNIYSSTISNTHYTEFISSYEKGDYNYSTSSDMKISNYELNFVLGLKKNTPDSPYSFGIGTTKNIASIKQYLNKNIINGSTIIKENIDSQINTLCFYLFFSR